MEQITLSDAKDHLEDLVARAVNGEDIRITDARLGTVRLAPVASAVAQTATPLRTAGRLRGVYAVPSGLFDPLPEDELKLWQGEDP